MKNQEAIAFASALDKNLQLFVDKEVDPSTELKLWEIGVINHQDNKFDPSLGNHFTLVSNHKLTKLILDTVPVGKRAIVIINHNNQIYQVLNIINIHSEQCFAIDAFNNCVLNLNKNEDKCVLDEKHSQSHAKEHQISVYITGSALT